jgi:predicted nucleic acid-binding Zn ribbon protein
MSKIKQWQSELEEREVDLSSNHRRAVPLDTPNANVTQPLRDAWDKEIQEQRRYLLDCLEAALFDSPKWPLIRQRVLKVFGRESLYRQLNS